MRLQITDTFFDIEFNNSKLANEIAQKFPIEKNIDWKYWDELYFLTDFWLSLDENAKEVMEIWDITYWVKHDWTKEAIAIFFWNTPAWDWTKPRPISKCSVIWKIIWNKNISENIWKWDFIAFLK